MLQARRLLRAAAAGAKVSLGRARGRQVHAAPLVHRGRLRVHVDEL